MSVCVCSSPCAWDVIMCLCVCVWHTYIHTRFFDNSTLWLVQRSTADLHGSKEYMYMHTYLHTCIPTYTQIHTWSSFLRWWPWEKLSAINSGFARVKRLYIHAHKHTNVLTYRYTYIDAKIIIIFALIPLREVQQSTADSRGSNVYIHIYIHAYIPAYIHKNIHIQILYLRWSPWKKSIDQHWIREGLKNVYTYVQTYKRTHIHANLQAIKQTGSKRYCLCVNHLERSPTVNCRFARV